MRGTVDRLHEKRQVELAKSILEDAGYKVEKRVGTPSLDKIKRWMYPVSEILDNYGEEDFIRDRGGTDELDIPCEMLDGTRDNVYVIGEEEEGAGEVFRFFRSLKREDVRKQEFDGGYCILVNTDVGPFVYQNISGFESLFKKF